ncbi:hypothetical protein MMC11_000053 [Xylographa trunciseda]|nr:hypothetical protein [Xylographa trunciseda]
MYLVTVDRMETVQRDLMITLPIDTDRKDTLLTTGLLCSSHTLYLRLGPEIWRKIFSFLVPEHLRIPRYTRGWMGKQWKQLDDFIKLTAVFRIVQDDLYQTLCAECTFSVADGVRQKNTMTVVPALERAAEFFGKIGLQHFRHVKRIQFMITGNTTGAISSSEAKQMLDALETLLSHCSPSMKLKDAQLRCHTLPVEYYHLNKGTRITIPGYVLDGPKPQMSFIGPRSKNLRAFERGIVSLERLNATLMQRYDRGPQINIMKAIPPELRLEVYDMLMVHAPTEYVIRGNNRPWERTNFFPALLAVNMETRHEFSRLLYSRCQFRFITQFSTKSLKFINKIGSANAAHIRDITITFDIYDDEPVPTIRPLLLMLPNFATLKLNASKFVLQSVTVENVRPWCRWYHVFSIPETGRNKLEVCATTSWTRLTESRFHRSMKMQLDVLRRAFQASIDGKELTISAQGILATYWPAGTSATEKHPKAKKIRR